MALNIQRQCHSDDDKLIMKLSLLNLSTKYNKVGYLIDNKWETRNIEYIKCLNK